MTGHQELHDSAEEMHFLGAFMYNLKEIEYFVDQMSVFVVTQSHQVDLQLLTCETHINFL